MMICAMNQKKKEIVDEREREGGGGRWIKPVKNGLCYHLAFMIVSYHTLLASRDSMDPRLRFVR